MPGVADSGPTLSVYAETPARGCLLFTFDPPGLLSRGVGLADALEAGLREAQELRGFLEECSQTGLLDETWGPDEVPTLSVAETFSRRGRADNGNTRATFKRDLEAVRPQDLPGYLTVMGHLRETLRTLYDRIPPEALEFRSLPHRMTIREQLRHIYGCDRWYLGRFWSRLPVTPRAADLWDRLTLHRQQALDLLSGMSREDMGAVRERDGQVWTARKLFRRFMYHEKFHRDTIGRDLALFLAGR